ncbi:MFS transporter [Nitriliruptoraceae bacterium ZYF776]|nr:MFS transporter [Profundirhabdus halotolerans]
MRSYLALLSHRDARWPLLTSTFSRLTPGMIALALVLMARQAGYSYAVAGALTAAHQIGTGLASPFQGKLVDRFGQTVVLVPDAILYALGTGLLALLATVQAPVAVLLGVAVITGAFFPPTTACARVVLSRLFPTGQLRETAFALSSIAVELGFIVGPLAATAVATSAGARWSVVLAGAFALVGGLGFAATGASRGTARRDVVATGRGGALRSPGVVVVVATFAFIAVVFGAIDVVLPAVAEFAGQEEAAGSLIAAIAAGSLLGGLVYGSRAWPGKLRDRLRILVVVLGVSLAIVPVALPALTPFRIALFLGGLALGPVTIVAFQLIDDLALPGTQTEAQSWTQSAIVFGVAGGAAAAGQLVETASPQVALFVGAGSVAIGACIAFAGARHLVVPAHGEPGAPAHGRPPARERPADPSVTFEAASGASGVGLVTPTHLGDGWDQDGEVGEGR